jgi:FdhD protein
MKTMLEIEIVKVDVSSRKTYNVTDYVAEEKPLHLFLNKTHCATIFCSPSDLKELAIGYLLSGGILKSVCEIDEVSLNEEKAVCCVRLKPDIDVEKRLKLWQPFSRVIFSGCGSQLPYQFFGRLSKIESSLTVKAETALRCVGLLNSNAEVFRKTGGTHAAAIHKRDGSVEAFAEDVGRHNAVDKVIGIAALNKTDLGNCFLVLSGRLSADIVLKAARVGLPVVASLAAALDSGIKVAKKAHLTLIGFARGNRMNIYTSPNRIQT